ncbi:RNA polymerase sigma factor [Dongia sp.]|uniref:RNA polymerase sigma factor n=1 Tax=Dongia sp. TaxID=1977262 RepID=UPI0035B18BC0
MFTASKEEYEDHWRRLTRRAMRMGLSREEGEDLAQEALYLATRNVPHLDGSDLRAWTTAVLRNRALNVFRTSAHREMRGSLSLDDLENHDLDPGRAPDQDQAVLLKQALRVLAALPERARRLITLITIEGYSYEEVSEMVGLPLGTVKSALVRAQAELRSRLSEGRGANRRRETWRTSHNMSATL